MKEEILEHCLVCVKSKRGPKGSRKRDVCHANKKKAISHNFGVSNNFSPKNSEGESESTNYTDIQSEYVGNLGIRGPYHGP